MPEQNTISESFANELASLGPLEFIESPQYLNIPLFPAQRIAIKAIYGIELSPDEFEIYKLLVGGGTFIDTDGTEYPPQFPREVTSQHLVGEESIFTILICGRRSGKSLGITAPMALYESICRAHIWRQHMMHADEKSKAVIIATRESQAKDIIQAQCTNLIMRSPKLACLVLDKPKALSLDLINGCTIASYPCSNTAALGGATHFMALDEGAHFRAEGFTTAASIWNAVIPSMGQFQGKAKSVIATSPAARQGLVWDLFKDGFEQPETTVIQAPSRLMGNLVPASFVAREFKRDPEYAMREYGAHFAMRMSSYFPACLEECYRLGGDMEYKSGNEYCAGMDQSGLTGRDNYAFAIAHIEVDGRMVHDIARIWDVIDLEEIMGEIRKLCKEFNVKSISHDRYAAGWVDNTLRRFGLSGNTSPMLPVVYSNLKSLVNSGDLYLQDDIALRDGLSNTMAVYGKNNSLSIYHERNNDGHADAADATARAIYAASLCSPDEITEDIVSFDCLKLVKGFLPLN